MGIGTRLPPNLETFGPIQGRGRETRAQRPTLIQGRGRETRALTSSSLLDLGYYEFARPELLALMPTSARRVLDVGCGAGRLREALKARQTVHVAGIEVVPEAAALARGRLDEVFAGDVEKLDLPFAAGAFDCIVCGDVIEHLREPASFLEQARGWLETEGLLVACLPNVRKFKGDRSRFAQPKSLRSPLNSQQFLAPFRLWVGMSLLLVFEAVQDLL